MKTFVLLLVGLLASVSQAQTVLSTAPNEVLTLPKGVITILRANLSYGSRLIIQPGTTIRVSPGYSFYGLNCAIEAVGTQAEPIVFECSDPTQYWLGIQLINLSATRPRNNLRLEWVTMRHVGRQANVAGFSSCVTLDNRSDASLSNCTLVLTKQTGKPTQGVYAFGSSTVCSITDTLIDGGSLGLRQSGGAAFVLNDVLVTNCTMAHQNENQASLLNGVLD